MSDISEWIVRRSGTGSAFLLSTRLARAGLAHAFTLRSGGEPSEAEAPVARGTEGPAAALAWWASVCEPPRRWVRPRQVHGAVVARAAADGDSTVPAEADGVLVDRPGCAAAVATADCVGGILTVPGGEAFVVLHAGWRGILAGIVEASVAALSEAISTSPAKMILATGPAVHGCCYEVGEEVEERFSALFTTPAERAAVFGSRNGRLTLDPPAAVRLLADRAGLEPGDVHDAGMCTMCRSDVCWSYRAHGSGAGRMWTAAAVVD